MYLSMAAMAYGVAIKTIGGGEIEEIEKNEEKWP